LRYLAERIMEREERKGEAEALALNLASDYAKRGGVPKVARVDAPHSKCISAGGFHSAAVDDDG
jgi:hypothetical protein